MLMPTNRMRKSPQQDGAIKKLTGNYGIEIPGSGDSHGEQPLCRFSAMIYLMQYRDVTLRRIKQPLAIGAT
jgi:hypothetical protein